MRSEFKQFVVNAAPYLQAQWVWVTYETCIWKSL